MENEVKNERTYAEVEAEEIVVEMSGCSANAANNYYGVVWFNGIKVGSRTCFGALTLLF